VFNIIKFKNTLAIINKRDHTGLSLGKMENRWELSQKP
jgi:hypothetical protein